MKLTGDGSSCESLLCILCWAESASLFVSRKWTEVGDTNNQVTPMANFKEVIHKDSLFMNRITPCSAKIGYKTTYHAMYTTLTGCQQNFVR